MKTSKKPMDVKEQARLIGNELLRHQRQFINAEIPDRIEPKDSRKYTVGYKKLFERAGVPFSRNCGKPLERIGEWCEKKRWPDLHALAVNVVKNEPGFNYVNAPGRPKARDWPRDLADCLKCREYPDQMPL